MLAKTHTQGKLTVNLRHPVACAMMLPAPYAVPNTVQPMIQFAVSGHSRVVLASILARLETAQKRSGSLPASQIEAG